MQSSSLTDVLVPFRVFVPSGTSTFDVPVPCRHLEGRKFHFERLTLSPHLFSQEAAAFGVEAEEEGLVVYKSDIRLDAEYVGDKKNFYPSSFKPSGMTKAAKFVPEFNAFFEANKPDYIKRCPVFFDWTHLELDPEDDPVQKVELFDEMWFNEPYSEDKHGNGLPASLADMRGVNHLKYPESGAFAVASVSQANFRVRLFLAPCSKVVFSSFGPLQDLGFSASQFGEQKAVRQITIINPEVFYTEFTAVAAPKIDMTSTSCTVHIYPGDSTAMSYSRLFEISAKDFKNHATLASLLNAKIQECAQELNVNFSLKYDETEKKFKFSFPSSDQIALSLFLQRPELSLRLGYFHSQIINKESEAKEIKDILVPSNVTDAFQKCVALCYDTGIVLCTLDQFSSNITSGALDFYMASLFPTISGVMEMNWCNQSVPPGVFLEPSSGSSAMIPVRFRLLRIFDNEEMGDFVWKDGAWVSGMLKGVLWRPRDTLV